VNVKDFMKLGVTVETPEQLLKKLLQPEDENKEES
jgi:hypothetical protein